MSRIKKLIVAHGGTKKFIEAVKAAGIKTVPSYRTVQNWGLDYNQPSELLVELLEWVMSENADSIK